MTGDLRQHDVHVTSSLRLPCFFFYISPIIVGSGFSPDVIIFSTAHPTQWHTKRQVAQMLHVYMHHGLFPIEGKRVCVNIVQ